MSSASSNSAPELDWVLLVSSGTVIEYPPELYTDRVRAIEEAERWAWILTGAGWLDVERPFVDRWQVGDRDVRLVPVRRLVSDRGPWWVGTFWDRSGTPDPEAALFAGRAAALEWVLEPPLGLAAAVETQALPWFVAATYLNGSVEEYAVAHLAKCVT